MVWNGSRAGHRDLAGCWACGDGFVSACFLWVWVVVFWRLARVTVFDVFGAVGGRVRLCPFKVFRRSLDLACLLTLAVLLLMRKGWPIWFWVRTDQCLLE